MNSATVKDNPSPADTAPETFAPEVGHPHLQARILRSYRQGRLPHAFLFHGPEGCGKDAFAIALAQLVNCADEQGLINRQSPQFARIAHLQHPDCKFIFPTPAESNLKDEELRAALQEKAANPYRRVTFGGKNRFIGIDTVRELKREARFKLYEGRRKVFILSEAEQMRTEAANALLKLLEEPPANLMLILTTARIHQILPTIKSRCQMFRFSRLPLDHIVDIVKRYAPDADDTVLPTLIRLSGFNIKRTFDFLEKDVLPLRDRAVELLRKIVVIHKAQELMEIIEPVAGQRDREEARLLLWFLLLWFQDILHLQRQTHPVLFNEDQRETLEKFLTFLPHLDVAGVVWEIEQAMRELQDPRNLNPLLILGDLAIKLHRQIKSARK